jgi:cobalamin biosynthesis Mg chelatase CobN
MVAQPQIAKAGVAAAIEKAAAEAVIGAKAVKPAQEAAAAAKAAQAANDAAHAGKAAEAGAEAKAVQVDIGGSTKNVVSADGSLMKIEAGSGEAKQAQSLPGGGDSNSIPWWGWVIGTIVVLALIGMVTEAKGA